MCFKNIIIQNQIFFLEKPCILTILFLSVDNTINYLKNFFDVYVQSIKKYSLVI